MQFNDFKRIVTCFADDGGDVLTDHGELLVQIRDETITAKVTKRSGDLLVEEEGFDGPMAARVWIVKRLARLPLLADRICSYVQPPEHFVSPSGDLLDQLERDPEDKPRFCRDAGEALREKLDDEAADATSVWYLTSNAGEGKTSIIEEMAVRQAERYKAKQADWLLVPIPLGGGTFLRFDDVVVSALVNKLRFQLLYYDAFLELVRLGVLVPAFDGFEEMIVESSSHEAISALGNLVGKLESEGNLLFAARKARFDYTRSTALLFDTIGRGQGVTFGQLSLRRWDRDTFVSYAEKRSVADPSNLYKVASSRLGEEHPVLTRAVLVKRLVDVATEDADISSLLDRISQDQHNYFHDFVGSIVKREAESKWIDKSGDPPRALLAIEEHHDLLSMLAREMWLGSTNELGIDVVSLVVEDFVDENLKSPAVLRQIQRRIREHSLLKLAQSGARSGGQKWLLGFDHEDVRIFYLGQALGRALVADDPSGVRAIIEMAALPSAASAEACRYIRLIGDGVLRTTLALLQTLADANPLASFATENCGLLTIGLIDGQDGDHEAHNMTFPADALDNRRLTNFRVLGSYFQGTSLEKTKLCRCEFVNCQFERLEIDDSLDVSDTLIDDTCRIASVVLLDDQISRFAPKQIRRELVGAGFSFPTNTTIDQIADQGHDDEDLVLVQRFLRPFLRATVLYESTIRQRLGVNANHFVNNLLPKLRIAGVVKDVPTGGHGSLHRMRLAAPMKTIEEAMSASGGTFAGFVEEVRRGVA